MIFFNMYNKYFIQYMYKFIVKIIFILSNYFIPKSVF